MKLNTYLSYKDMLIDFFRNTYAHRLIDVDPESNRFVNFTSVEIDYLEFVIQELAEQTGIQIDKEAETMEYATDILTDEAILEKLHWLADRNKELISRMEAGEKPIGKDRHGVEFEEADVYSMRASMKHLESLTERFEHTCALPAITPEECMAEVYADRVISGTVGSDNIGGNYESKYDKENERTLLKSIFWNELVKGAKIDLNKSIDLLSNSYSAYLRNKNRQDPFVGLFMRNGKLDDDLYGKFAVSEHAPSGHSTYSQDYAVESAIHRLSQCVQ